MDIRSFEEADLDAVVALWRQCGLIVPWNDPAADIRLARNSGHGAVLVGCEGPDILASVMIGHDGHRGWLYYLAVDPARREAGFGRQIVEAAETWAVDRGIRKVELMIRGSNAAVREFYDRLGYRSEDVIVMSRWLDGTAPKD